MRSFAIAALFGAVSQATATGKCYALALSSGDQNSSYQAGVLSAFAANLSADEIAYQAVSGVSGGAINAAILASFDAGSE